MRNIGLAVGEKIAGGIHFDGSWQDCYKANLFLRSASRVVMPVLQFKAKSPEELYQKTKEHDFTQYIDAKGTIAVDSFVRASPAFTDQRFFSLKIKDAVVDQFRDKFGERPSVDKEIPDLLILARASGDDVYINIDTSGESLFKRGYRVETTLAPLKENLAAGLVLMTGWDGKTNFIDPMCGSGTLLIEAALLALNIAPGMFRKRFGFQKLKNYDKEMWNSLVDMAISSEKTELDVKFFGYDLDGKALRSARANAESAGVAEFIEFKRTDARILEPPCESGLIVVNPPYGERLGLTEQLKDVYRDFGHTLKTRFKGWTCWLLSGNSELSEELKLKANEKHKVMNGPIECRFMKYEIKNV